MMEVLNSKGKKAKPAQLVFIKMHTTKKGDTQIIKCTVLLFVKYFT